MDNDFLTVYKRVVMWTVKQNIFKEIGIVNDGNFYLSKGFR